ncbi:MAG: hypothetical protein VX815_08045 [Gemmatimonadota bacterium]|nr:hypothetical protein [Gemmatimonadota bacterium]
MVLQRGAPDPVWGWATAGALVTVRYAWQNWIVGSLFNNAGLPASSFRTDEW